MNLFKASNEKVEDYFFRIRNEGYTPKSCYQNISITSIEKVLKKLDKYSDDMRDVIYCLTNNELPNLYTKVNRTLKLSAGASVAHIGSYIGILLRGKNKLDREGRDYWIKPLVEIGILVPITLNGTSFIPGHIKAKSPNSSYKLSDEFMDLLANIQEYNFDEKLKQWINSANERERLSIIVEKNTSLNYIVDGSHKKLIEDSINIYAKHYLPGYICIFKDADNGDRINETEQYYLYKYGITFGLLDDVWPDAILYNPDKNSLWFIEAVTSDGEVDSHKLKGFKRICENSNKEFGGCTTTYFTLKRFYERQNSQNNLAQGSYFWIKDLAEKHFYVT